jgi:hypothetical protein
MNNKQLNKILHPKKAYLISGIILILASIAAFYIVSYLDNHINYPEVVSYHDLIQSGSDKNEAYAKVDITSIMKFAKNDDNLNYYYVSDEEGYTYIARITDDTYNDIIEVYNNDKENFIYTLTGYIYDVPNDLKSIAMSAFKDYTGNIELTEDTYSSYLGSTYLDETMTPNTQNSGLLVSVGILLAAFGIIFIVFYFVSTRNLKKTLNKYGQDYIEHELLKSSTLCFPKENVYITDSCLISSQYGLALYKYKDILWMYLKKTKYNGISTGIRLLAATRNNKIITVGSTFRNKKRLLEIMGSIKERNMDIMLGYTKENKAAFKNIIRNTRERMV